MPVSVDNELSELLEIKKLLEELSVSLLEKEDTFAQAINNVKKWEELSRVIADLRVPVRDLKTSTESLMSKAETLIDDIQLREILTEMIQSQNENLTSYLERANANVLKISSEMNNSLKEVIMINSNLVHKFSSYLATVTQNKKEQSEILKRIKQLYLILGGGLILAIVLPLFAVYTMPPMSPKYAKVLDALHERIFSDK